MALLVNPPALYADTNSAWAVDGETPDIRMARRIRSEFANFLQAAKAAS